MIAARRNRIAQAHIGGNVSLPIRIARNVLPQINAQETKAARGKEGAFTT